MFRVFWASEQAIEEGYRGRQLTRSLRVRYSVCSRVLRQRDRCQIGNTEHREHSKHQKTEGVRWTLIAYVLREQGEHQNTVNTMQDEGASMERGQLEGIGVNGGDSHLARSG